MPGIGIRLWRPLYNNFKAENPLTSIQHVVPDAIALNGTTINFKSYTGNILVRMIGRCQKADRPMVPPITVKWGATAMKQEAFFAQNGAGGTFVGIWTLVDQEPAEAPIVISCGTTDAGCTAIRVGELNGQLTVVKALAGAGASLTHTIMAGSAFLEVGGLTDTVAYPISSADLTLQWSAYIAPQTELPNRTKGLAGHFGLTYENPADGKFDLTMASMLPEEPLAATDPAIAGIEIRSAVAQEILKADTA